MERTLTLDPDILGLTCLTIEAPILNEFSKRIRERAPNVFQVAGGVHATCFQGDLLNQAPLDAVVLGEGELTFEQIISARERGDDLSSMKAVAYRDKGVVRCNGGSNTVENLDSLPHPAWDLIPVRKYFGKRMGDLLFARPQQMSVYTSRSCPYKCIYCHQVFGKGFRARSADKVFEEFSILYNEYGIREFHIQDDIFNLDKDRFKTICRRIIDSDMDLAMAFPNGLRADIMDEEGIDLLHRAGARRIAYAVESASLRIQHMIRKRLDLEKLADTVKKTAKRGILVKGFFMLGFPTETKQEMESTFRFARIHDFDVINFSRVIPTKGTELYEMAKQMGLKTDFGFDQYVYDYSTINLSAVDDQTFEKLIRKAYRTFLNRPRRLFRLIRLFPNKKQIFPYYFFLLLVKLFLPKKPKDLNGLENDHWWQRIRP